jgi:hypothetical protein
MDSVVLEVAVGLALLYYVTATLVSGVAEGLTRLMNVRSKTLWSALGRMLDQQSSAGSSLGAPFHGRHGCQRSSEPARRARVGSVDPEP